MFFERSGYHLFTWRGIDVFVSMWYMILMAFIVFMPVLTSGNVISGVIFALAVTVSLLIHEFGHALVSKHYNLGPSILLHGFGGLCMSDAAASDGDDAKIVLAGPFAGLFAGALMFGLQVVFPGIMALSPLVASFVVAFIWINIVWSLVNLLLPIWPLDGGQLFHLLLRRFMPEHKAQTLTLNISIMVTILAGIVGFWLLRGFFIAFFCLFVIMDNYNTLTSGRSLLHRKAKERASSMHEELLQDAERCLQEGDWREAARLAHVMRSLGKMPPKMLQRVWIILGLATLQMQEYDEALGYLERAPDVPEVLTAREQCQQHVQR